MSTEEDLALLDRLEARMDKLEELIKEELEFQKLQELLVRDTKRTINYYKGEKEKLETAYEEKIAKIETNIAIVNSNTEKIRECKTIEELKGLTCPVLK